MSGILGSGPKTSPERYAGIQVTTSMQGQVIPYVAGRQRVNMNLLWYGNFKSQANHSGGGKGGSPTSSYTYSCSFIAALALGPITGIHQVWFDKSATSLTLQNLAYALGNSGQPTWSGYPSGTPSGQEIPYDHLAYVASSEYVLGSTAAMPDLTFEIEGVVGGYDNTHGVYDADPSAVVVDYLTDPVHGAAFQGMIETLTGTSNTYQAYCMSLGLLVSPFENNQRAATDFIKELMQITNSDLVLSCGTLKVIPYADQAVSGTTPNGIAWSYTPNLTPIFSFTDDDFCPKKGDEPVKLIRKALTDTYNIVNLNFLDRSNYYNQSPASASDEPDISIRGPKAMSTLTFSQVTQASVARTVAELILRFQLYERNSYQFRVPAVYSLLEPMDIIAITDSGLGLTDQVCRITQVQDDADNYITITAMEVPGTVRNTPQYNWDSAQGYYANFGEAPGSVAAPAIFQMPPIPGAFSDGITIGIAVGPPTIDSASWGGCEVYCSTDGGNTYGWVGTVGPMGVPRYGTISANFPSATDPDSTSTMSVALQDTAQQLATTVTHAQADANETLIMVGSGATAEVMSYGTASLVSAGNYDLSYFRRGLYGTAPEAQTTGAQFVRLDGSIFQLALDPGMGGQTVYFKFCSFNAVGNALEDLSAVTAYSFTLPVASQASPTAVALIARGSIIVDGESVYKGTGAFAWDSDAVSAKPLTAGNISAQYGAGGALGIGFVTSTGSTANPNSNMYAIYAHADSSQTVVIENGTVRYTGSIPNAGDLYDVRYDGFSLFYYINGSLVWSTPLQGASLYPAVAEYSVGAVLSDVQVAAGTAATPTQWKAAGSCTVNDENVYGGTGAWGGGAAYSIVGYGQCHITGKVDVSGNNGAVMIGLSTNPTSNLSYTNANYAWHDSGGIGGTWFIFESGTAVTLFGTVAATDVVWISYDGTNVRYYINDPTTPVRTVAASGLTLYGFCPLYGPGAQINSLRFAPTVNLAVQDTSQLGTNAATVLGQSSASNVGLTSTANTTICSVTIGPFPQDTETVLTVNSSWLNGSSVNNVIELWVNSSSLGSFFNSSSAGQNIAPVASAPGITALEQELTIPAGTTETFTLVGRTSAIGGATAVESICKLEGIKR